MGNQVTIASRIDLREGLQKLLKAETLTDTSLRIGTASIKAHRCVLAAASQYFCSMFTGNYVEKDQHEIDLTHALSSLTVLQHLVDFMYGGEIPITEETVNDLLSGAGLFMLPDLTVLCVQFLLQNLKLQNCLWIWSLADMYSLTELQKICQDLAITNFHDTLINLDDTVTIPPEYLLSFFKQGLAKNCEKSELAQFIDKYVQYDPGSRQERLSELQAAVGLLEGNMDKIPSESDVKGATALCVAGKGEGSGEKDPADKISSAIRDLSVQSKSPVALHYHSGAIPKSRVGEVSMSSSPVVSNLLPPQGSEELVIWTSLQNCAIYSTSKRKWFTMDDPFVDDKSRTWKVEALGVGSEHEMVLLRHVSSSNLRLYNLETEESIHVPSIGNSPSFISFFCDKGVLYCIFKSTKKFPEWSHHSHPGSQYKSKPAKENPPKEVKHCKIQILWFNIKRAKWHYAGVALRTKGTDMSLKVVHQREGVVFILVIQMEKVCMIKFYPSNGIIAEMASYPKKQLSEAFVISYHHVVIGTPDKILLRCHDGVLVYDIRKNVWEMQSDINFFPNTKVADGMSCAVSVVNGQVYYSSTRQDVILQLRTYDPLSGESQDLSPMPYQGPENTLIKPTVVLAPSAFLSHLKAASHEAYIDKTVLTEGAVQRTLERFKVRMKMAENLVSDDGEQSDMLNSSEEEDEDDFDYYDEDHPWMRGIDFYDHFLRDDSDYDPFDVDPDLYPFDDDEPYFL